MKTTWWERKTARMEKKLLHAGVISLGAAILLIIVMWIGHLIHIW